jgi:tetratricopeptide (TPR) repeat protein
MRQAIAAEPEVADFHSNLSVALKAQGKLPAAVAACRRALALNPNFADALVNLGVLLAGQGQAAEAEEAFRRAVSVSPNHANAHYSLGNVLKDRGRWAQAAACYETAWRIDSRFVDALSNLGVVRKEAGDVAGALACFRQALEINPRYVDAHSNMAFTLRSAGRVDEALACLNEAISLRPHAPDLSCNRAFLWLSLGNFERGWPEYEYRWQLPGRRPRPFSQPHWDGAGLAGKTILIYAEQGLGDTIQFIRYASLVKERGGKVVFESQPALVPLLSGVAGVDVLVAHGKRLPRFDVQVPLLSLPGIFRTTLATIPTSTPYLRADPDLVARWRAALPAGRTNIGIAWHGSSAQANDRHRSIPLAHFKNLAAMEGVTLVSLQKGEGAEQMCAWGPSAAPLDFGAAFDKGGAFLDTAALMKSLDLVVTADTAVAHVAGALGVPVWTALCFDADWRWLRDREDCPWYPAMRLFRQQRPGDWGEVFDRIVAAITQRGGINRQAQGDWP